MTVSTTASQVPATQLFDVVVYRGGEVVRIAYERRPLWIAKLLARKCKQAGERCKLVESPEDYCITFEQNGQTFTLRCNGVHEAAAYCFVSALKDAGIAAKIISVLPTAAPQSA